jgi:hypothetical protein
MNMPAPPLRKFRHGASSIIVAIAHEDECAIRRAIYAAGKYKDLSPISANLVAFPANVTKIGNALHRPFRRKIFQYVPSTARRNE